jgi:hypothetical protein
VDPGRRRLLDSLNARNGQTLRELCADMDMARQSVSKHVAVLEAADLVTTVWRGREKLPYPGAAAMLFLVGYGAVWMLAGLAGYSLVQTVALTIPSWAHSMTTGALTRSPATPLAEVEGAAWG